MNTTVITIDDIFALMKRYGINATPLVLDEKFRMPSPEWVRTTFSDALTSMVNQMDYTYVSEARDCDDFARFAAWYMAYLHARMPDSEGTGIAAIEFGYYELHVNPPFGGYHAIVSTINKTIQGIHELLFWEPQLTLTDRKITKVCMSQLTLEPDEISSCIYFRL